MGKVTLPDDNLNFDEDFGAFERVPLGSNPRSKGMESELYLMELYRAFVNKHTCSSPCRSLARNLPTGEVSEGGSPSDELAESGNASRTTLPQASDEAAEVISHQAPPNTGTRW